MRSRGAFAWVARTSSSEKGLYAISPLFDRARRIAPGEVPEDVADEGERAGDANDRGRRRTGRHRERLDRGRDDLGARDGPRDHRTQRRWIRRAWVRRRGQDETARERRQLGEDRARVLVMEDPHHERDGSVAEKVAQGGGERAGAAGVVGAVEHEPSAGARGDLEAPRPPRAPEPVADRRIADAELTGRGHGEQSVLGLVAPEHAEPQTGDGPAGSGAADQPPVETTALDRDGPIAPRDQQRDAHPAP